MADLYPSLFRNVLYPAYESGLRRRKTLRYLREYERNQWLSTDELLALQWHKLSALITHCWEHVPYYRGRWAEAGMRSPADIARLDDYARLPLLTKADMRRHASELVAKPYVGKLMFKSTGGSTGEPLNIGFTRESYERRCAVMYRGYAWAGAPLGTRELYLWGEDLNDTPMKHRLMNAAFNRRIINVYTMSEAVLPAYADSIDRYRPRAIVGYAMPIHRLAQWLLANGRKVHAPNSILSAAERLLPHQRAEIEAAFGCPVFNTYGCREVMLIASECERREGLHVNADHLCVQLGAPVEGGGEHAPREVLLTDLHNWGMPLMRYSVGDLAVEGPGSCGCGRGLPMLASIEGRTMDVLRTREGHFVGEYLESLVFDTPGIDRFQAVQNHIDSIDVTIIPGSGFSQATLDRLSSGMRDAFGDCIRLDFHLAQSLPLTPSGKLRVTISNLGPNALELKRQS